VQLGFGQWLTKEFNGAFQQFMYFGGTLMSLEFTLRLRALGTANGSLSQNS
jgi:hypothetical protein